MRRIVAVCAAFVILITMAAASAGTAGTSSDPLVSLSYISGTFYDALKNDVRAEVRKPFNSASARLDALNNNGYHFAPRYTGVALSEGQKLSLITGGSFVLLTGLALLEFSGEAVINVSTGAAVASGTHLTPFQRYFCAETTIAVITASSPSSGYLDGYYSTDGVITSAPVTIPDENHSVFKDIKLSDWFCEAVDYVYSAGLFTGVSDDMFSPNTPMTRGMFVTVLHRMANKPLPNFASAFSDVEDPSKYYYNAVSWANETGIVTGYGDGKFVPDASITREQMAAIIHRYTLYSGVLMTASGGSYDSFPDTGAVSAYAVDSMRWAVSNGIINGADGKLQPASTATRAQVAQIVFNFNKNTEVRPES